MIDVIVVVEGGVVQDIYASNSKAIRVTLIDYDNLGFEENAEITQGNYYINEMEKNWAGTVLDLVKDEETINGEKIKVYEPTMQCCTCENYFKELTEDNCCPKCGSGNWVYGYIDEKGYYEDANRSSN